MCPASPAGPTGPRDGAGAKGAGVRMYESPRDRRLKSDHQALERLKVQSSILDFEVVDSTPTRYIVSFRVKGLMQPPNSDAVTIQEFHQVEIRLGVNYPRSKPDLKWKSPLFHPNISALA